MVNLIVLKCLVNQIEWKALTPQKDVYKIQYLNQRIAQLQNQSNFASLICQALADITVVPDGFLSLFFKALKLSFVPQITVALGLTNSTNDHLAEMGMQLVLA